jgi:cysteine synthase B|tara:strand:+ start:774 stop:1667 length:894 start_codon:yes stop_codon:yes gene_type:complete
MFLENTIGNTPLVTLQRMCDSSRNRISVKLEGNNPAGSIKDRAAYSMIRRAELRGEISPGDTLVEATSGNTGIALAMVAATKGYHMILITPDNMTRERHITMSAYGAEIILVTKQQGMVGARDLAIEMQAQGKAKLLDQFANPDNPLAHFETTAPEIWQQTNQTITHFVCSMGTTGTIVGCSRYFKKVDPSIQIIGVQPEDGSVIVGIRRWPEEYVPKIYDATHVDRIMDISQSQAEQTARQLASQEGIFCGVSSGGGVAVALQVLQQLETDKVTNAHIVAIICDRGDRYVSSNLFE